MHVDSLFAPLARNDALTSRGLALDAALAVGLDALVNRVHLQTVQGVSSRVHRGRESDRRTLSHCLSTRFLTFLCFLSGPLALRACSVST